MSKQQRLTDEIFDALSTRGYAIVHNYLPEARRVEMAAALRCILKPWNEIKADPPDALTDTYYFPYPEQCLNHAIIDREAIAFAQRWLGTEHIHYRPGLGLVTYPGRKNGTFHIDNGNNSLLPPTASDHNHSQLNFWFCLEDVDEDQAPTLFVDEDDGQHRDPAKAEAMAAPGGSVAIFHNYSWHAASAISGNSPMAAPTTTGKASRTTRTSDKTRISANLSPSYQPPTASSSAFPHPNTPTTPARRSPP